MKVIDITMTIHPDMEIYPGDAAPKITRYSNVECGDMYNVSSITVGTHTGTHVDPPLHLFEAGAGIDALPLEKLVGPARVLDVSTIDGALEPVDIGPVKANEILLLKGPSGGAHVSTAAAWYLADKGINTVGTNALSISTSEDEYEAHCALLNAGIAVIEGLSLTGVDAGNYFFVCLPLKIAEGDGGPARAILIAGY
jgi:arylformamidase